MEAHEHVACMRRHNNVKNNYATLFSNRKPIDLGENYFLSDVDLKYFRLYYWQMSFNYSPTSKTWRVPASVHFA